VSLPSQDLERFQEAALEQFNAGVADASEEDRLSREVTWLQTELEQIYRFVVLLQKRETNMDRVAELWAAMVRVCDAFARTLSSLAEKSSSARVSYDRILDLRRAAEERYKLHVAP
jgi:hypothetical protein